jgi:hypothetical protein
MLPVLFYVNKHSEDNQYIYSYTDHLDRQVKE